MLHEVTISGGRNQIIFQGELGELVIPYQTAVWVLFANNDWVGLTNYYIINKGN